MQYTLFPSTKTTTMKKGIEKIVPVKRRASAGAFPIIKVTCDNTGAKRKAAVRNIYLTYLMRDTGLDWQEMCAGWTKANKLAIWDGAGDPDAFHISQSHHNSKGKTYTISNTDLVEAIFVKYGIAMPEGDDQISNLTFKAIEMAADPGTFQLELTA